MPMHWRQSPRTLFIIRKLQLYYSNDVAVECLNFNATYLMQQIETTTIPTTTAITTTHKHYDSNERNNNNISSNKGDSSTGRLTGSTIETHLIRIDTMDSSLYTKLACTNAQNRLAKHEFPIFSIFWNIQFDCSCNNWPAINFD